MKILGSPDSWGSLMEPRTLEQAKTTKEKLSIYNFNF